MDDLSIIELYFARDEQAIKETDVKYGKLCYRIAHNILNNKEDSEECVNDTYMRAWNNIPPKRPTVFSAFLAKITRNIAIDRYKGDHADKRADKLATSIEELYDAIEDNNTWNKLELVELGDLISKFLYTEKEAARRIFVLRYFYEYSIEDIAHIYATSASYVKTKLHRTRRALAKYLNDNGVAV